MMIRLLYLNQIDLFTTKKSASRHVMFNLKKNGEERFEELQADEVNQVFDLYYADVFRYVKFRISDPSLAEDIASETYLRLLEAIQKRSIQKSKVKGWLFTTASHIIVDHLREKYKKPEVELQEHVSDNEASVTEQVDAILRNENIQQGLSTLSVEQQEVINLRFNLAYSIQETAEIMGKNDNAIKQLQYRAITTLKNKLMVIK